MDTWDATETTQRIVAGEVSATEVVQAAIKRLESWNPRLNALTHFDPNGALQNPNNRARHVCRGATVIKDLEDLEGVPTRCGTQAFEPGPAKRHADTVAQFLATGLVSLGKTTTSEFGLTGTVEPVGGKPTTNPINLRHTAGGSSGGSAALVAAGVVPIAHGGDGGGSVRIWRILWIAGLKPSRGRLAVMEKPRKCDSYRRNGCVDDKRSRHSQLLPLQSSKWPLQKVYRRLVSLKDPVQTISESEHSSTRHPATVDQKSKCHRTNGPPAPKWDEIQWIEASASQQTADDFLLYWSFTAMLLQSC